MVVFFGSSGQQDLTEGGIPACERFLKNNAIEKRKVNEPKSLCNNLYRQALKVKQTSPLCSDSLHLGAWRLQANMEYTRY